MEREIDKVNRAREPRGDQATGSPGAHTHSGQPRLVAEGGRRQGVCRHPGPPGSAATLTVPWELMASDFCGPTAPSPSSLARLGPEAPPARLWALLSLPLTPLQFLPPPGVCRAGAQMLVRVGMQQRPPDPRRKYCPPPPESADAVASLCLPDPNIKTTLHPQSIFRLFSLQKPQPLSRQLIWPHLMSTRRMFYTHKVSRH